MSNPNTVSRFDEIYNSTSKTVLAFITAKCGRTADINDIFQDTYLELYQVLSKRGADYVKNDNAFMLHIAKQKIARYYSLLERLRFFVSMTMTGKDGEKVELTVTIDLSGPGLSAGKLSEKDVSELKAAALSEEESSELSVVILSEEQRADSMQRYKEKNDYYNNIPLEQCEIMLESVKIVTDVYEYEAGDSLARSFEIKKNEIEFDQDGVFRGTWWEIDEAGFVMVIRNDNGVLTGMIYKAPK